MSQVTGVRQDPVLNALDVVKRGRMLVVEESSIVQAFSTNSVLSIPCALERFVPMLTKTMKA